jgi:hypothetical protein
VHLNARPASTPAFPSHRSQRHVNACVRINSSRRADMGSSVCDR